MKDVQRIMRLAALLCLVAFVSGCASPASAPDMITTPAPTQSATHTENWTLGPRDGRELNLEMDAGASIAFRLASGASVRWDLHSHHETSGVITHHSGEGRLAEGTFTAPATDVYSIFARANGSTAIVKLTVEGVFEIAG